MTEYRQLKENEINAGLLDGFIRRQVVTKCLRRENGAWIAKNAPFIDDWTQKDREWIAADLKNLAGRGGLCIRGVLRREACGLRIGIGGNAWRKRRIP